MVKIYLKKINTPIKKLTQKLNKSSGHNNTGCLTVKNKIFGVSKTKYRLIDFKYTIWNIYGVVKTIEYDPYRNSFIALVYYPLINLLTYRLSPKNLIVNSLIFTGNRINLNPGNATYLKNIPISTKIFNIEAFPFSGGVYLRSAGAYGWIIEKTEIYCLVKFNTTKKIKKFSNWCVATIGINSNEKFRYKKLRKAGLKRFIKKKKSNVRGVAKNAVDHPHGGGKGKKSPPKVTYNSWRKLPKNAKTAKLRKY